MTSSKNSLSIDQLLKDVEPRSRLTPESERELFESLHAEWRSTLNKRKQRTWFAAIAATLVAGVLTTLYILHESTPATAAPTLVARVEARFGVEPNSALAQALADGTDLMSGRLIRTNGDARLALHLAGGGKLRLNQNTTVRLLGKQSVELISGSLYYDSNDRAPVLLDALYQKNTIVVYTPYGQLANRGTQFLVDATPGKLVVTVRSGAVDIVSGTEAIAIESGKQLVLRSNQAQELNDAAPYGDAWLWVEKTVPEFDLNNAPLTLLLEWVGHETGREIVFSSDEAMQLAQTSVLVGKVDVLPLDALQLWIETVDLEADVSDRHITIALRR